MGVYGYLTSAYSETSKRIADAQGQLTLIDTKIALFTSQRTAIENDIKSTNERISSYDNMRLTQENTFNQLSSSRRSTRSLDRRNQSLSGQIDALTQNVSALNAKTLAITDSIAALEVQKLNIASESFTAELGPLMYVSRITGLDMDVIANLFILLLVSVIDPLAVSLIIAVNVLNRKREKTHETISEISNDFVGGKEPHSSSTSDTESDIHTPLADDRHHEKENSEVGEVNEQISNTNLEKSNFFRNMYLEGSLQDIGSTETVHELNDVNDVNDDTIDTDTDTNTNTNNTKAIEEDNSFIDTESTKEDEDNNSSSSIVDNTVNNVNEITDSNILDQNVFYDEKKRVNRSSTGL